MSHTTTREPHISADPAERYFEAVGRLTELSHDTIDGAKLTCHEADALARVFDLLECPHLAEELRHSHVEGDDDPDDVHNVERHAGNCDGWCGVPDGCLETSEGEVAP